MENSQALMIFALVAVACIATTLVSAAITNQVAIPSTGSIKSVGLGVYQDYQCIYAASSIDWGVLEPGSSTDFTLYLRNEGTSDLTASMSSENWSPANAADYMTLTWNREGRQVSPDEVVSCRITLSVSEDIQDINSFSVDIIISGTG